MAHYAFLNENNIVTEVIVGKDESDTTHNWEEFYGAIRNQTCKRTSYNTKGNVHSNGGVALRGNYAGIGYTYDATNDVFYEPKPFASWVLGTNSWLWNPPITYPDDGNMYRWDEDVYQADNTKGWVLNG
tara:strand:+ start:1398 stop:1784 length:387 start_codon:yes stop_codon:yes gene_type:complete